MWLRRSNKWTTLSIFSAPSQQTCNIACTRVSLALRQASASSPQKKESRNTKYYPSVRMHQWWGRVPERDAQLFSHIPPQSYTLDRAKWTYLHLKSRRSWSLQFDVWSLDQRFKVHNYEGKISAAIDSLRSLCVEGRSTDRVTWAVMWPAKSLTSWRRGVWWQRSRFHKMTSFSEKRSLRIMYRETSDTLIETYIFRTLIKFAIWENYQLQKMLAFAGLWKLSIIYTDMTNKWLLT